MQRRNVISVFVPIFHYFRPDEGHIQIAGTTSVRIEGFAILPSFVGYDAAAQSDARPGRQPRLEFLEKFTKPQFVSVKGQLSYAISNFFFRRFVNCFGHSDRSNRITVYGVPFGTVISMSANTGT